MMLGYGGSGAFYFFMIQACGITLEMVVQYLITGSMRPYSPNDKPPPRILRFFGYIWTVCWIVAVSPFLQQPMVEAGLFVSDLSDTALGQNLGRILGLNVI